MIMSHNLFRVINQLSIEELLILYAYISDHFVMYHNRKDIYQLANVIKYNLNEAELVRLMSTIQSRLFLKPNVAVFSIDSYLLNTRTNWLQAALLCSLQKEHLFNSDKFITSTINKPIVLLMTHLIEASSNFHIASVVSILETKLRLVTNKKSLVYQIKIYLPPIT